MRLFTGRVKDSTKSTLVAGFFAISQLIFPFLAVTPVSAAANDISVADHEGELSPAGTYSNGNITEYTELDSINFRFDIKGDDASSGQMQVEFTSNDTGCLFFDGSFNLGTHDDSALPLTDITGATPTVTPIGTATNDGSDWIQLIDVTFSAEGSATVNYYLTLTDEAGECSSGSPQHSRLANSPNTGDFKNIGQQNVPIPSNQIIELPEIFVQKWVDSDGDGITDRKATAGEWSFALDDGTPVPTDDNGEVVFTNVTPDGNHTVTESNGPSGQSFIDGSGTNCTFQGAIATANIASGTTAQDATCIFNNGLSMGSLTVVKNVINDDGGELDYSDFTFKVDEGTAQNFEADVTDLDGFDGVKTISLPTGIYSVTEPEANTMGYTTSYSNCTDVVVTQGQTATCTITNDDVAPTLTVVKNVINDNGGTAGVDDFDLEMNEIDLTFGAGVLDGNTTTYTATPTVKANTDYTLSEIDFTGYEEGVWSCTDGTVGVDLEVTVNLNTGDDVTCTIDNNDDAPQLTLIKDISQFDNNGPALADDFVLHIVGGNFDLNDNFSTGDTPAVDSNVTYTLSEEVILNSDGDPGYELDRIECVIDGTDTSVLISDDQVKLDEGQSVTCTFFNDDIAPKLTVTKIVNNNWGGDLIVVDFPLYVEGTVKVEVDSGDQEEFDAGLHVVSETQQTGYKLTSLTGDCAIDGSITLEVGGVYSCTFTNDDKPPKLTLVKEVKNDYGTPADANLWTLSATPELNNDGAVTLSGDGNPTDGDGVDEANAFAGIVYTLSESDGTNGYSASAWKCDGGNLEGDELTLNLAENVTCTITNTADAPELTIIKKVVNDNGGILTSGDFTINVAATNPSDASFAGTDTPGTTITLDAGVYSVTEVTDPGYKVNYSGDCSGTINIGDSKTCTITNDDISPSLTLVKHVINDDGGDKQHDAWTLTANGPDLLQGIDNTESLETGVNGNVKAGTYSLSESDDDGYELTSIICNGRTVPLTDGIGQITLQLSADVLCVFTNDDIAPTLTIEKETDTIDENPEQMFELYVDQPEVDGVNEQFNLDNFTPVEGEDSYADSKTFTGEDNDLKAGLTVVGENVPDGWVLAEISCSPTGSDILIGETYLDDEYEFTLKPGDDITCTFVNVEQPDIKVTKYWDINQNGEFDDGEETLPDWTFNLEECVYLNGVTPLVVNSFGYVPGCDGPYGEADYESALVAYPILTQETDETGSTTFENLSPFSNYVLSEELQEGWNISGFTCNYTEEGGGGVAIDFNRYFIYPAPGETVECEVGNYQDTELLIDKTNNRIGDDLLPGDSVLYTIVVTNPEDSGIAYETVTYDILPAGVTYTSGSWEADSSVRGDLPSALDEGSDYTGASAATWELGDLEPGETVTLTYSATVDTDTEPGTYENIAWAEACAQKYGLLTRYPVPTLELQVIEEPYEDECCIDNGDYDYNELNSKKCGVVVFAQDVNSEEEDVFVESPITVVAEEGEVQGFVLGVLSETGVPAILPSVVGLSLAGTALLLARGGNRRERRWFKGLVGAAKHLVVAIALSLVFSTGAFAAGQWQLSVVDLPDTTSDNTPVISYSVASTDASDDFTVELYRGATLVSTQNVNTPNGGSGQFEVAELADGTYDFKVVADNDGSIRSHSQTVTIDTDTPSSPVFEGVERNGNTYTLRFTTPNTDVEKVRIYSSTNSEFDLNSANLVKTLTVNPDQDVQTNYTAPDSTQRYFAVVAVDSTGNQSAPVGDAQPSTTGGGGTASPVAVGGNGDGTDGNGDDVDGNGDGDGAVLPDQNGETDGDETDGETDDESEEDEGTNGWMIALLVAAILGAGYYYFGRETEN